MHGIFHIMAYSWVLLGGGEGEGASRSEPDLGMRAMSSQHVVCFLHLYLKILQG